MTVKGLTLLLDGYRRGEGTAARVAGHNDGRHTEMLDRIIHAGKALLIDDIAGGADDEQMPRGLIEHVFRGDVRIGAGEPDVDRVLALGQCRGGGEEVRAGLHAAQMAGVAGRLILHTYRAMALAWVRRGAGLAGPRQGAGGMSGGGRAAQGRPAREGGSVQAFLAHETTSLTPALPEACATVGRRGGRCRSQLVRSRRRSGQDARRGCL